MSLGWHLFVVFWLATTGAGIVGIIVFWRSRRSEMDGFGAVLLSGIAAAPSAATAVEYLLRTGKAVSLIHYATKTPLVLSMVLGPILLIASVRFTPVKMPELKAPVNATRIAHLCGWLCGACVGVLLLLEGS